MFSGEKTAIQKAKKPLTPIRKAQTGAKLQTQFFVPLLFFAMRLQLLRTKKGRAWRSPCEYGGSRMKIVPGKTLGTNAFYVKLFSNSCGCVCAKALDKAADSGYNINTRELSDRRLAPKRYEINRFVLLKSGG